MKENKLHVLAEAYFDGDLTEEQADQLTSLLLQSRENRKQFLHELEFCNLLSQVGRIFDDDEEFERAFWERVNAEENVADFTATFEVRRVKATEQAARHPLQFDSESQVRDVREIKQYAEQQLQQFLAEQEQLNRTCQPQPSHRLYSVLMDIMTAGQKVNAALIGTYRSVLVGFLLLIIGLTVYLSIQYALSQRVVATLGDSVNAQWEVPPMDSQLRPDWMTLKQGFAQIKFKKGTDIVIQAPCKFKLQSPNKMFLVSGSVAANVPKQAIGFTIETSTSRVVDFGTEFGLLARKDGSTETHVHNGRVGVKSSNNRIKSNDLKILNQGHAAAVDATGQIREIPYKPHQVVRSIAEAYRVSFPGIKLNLADIVGGGNGFGTGSPNSAIDAFTGKLILNFYDDSWANRLVDNQPMSVCKYVQVPTHDYVDGVFSPTANPMPITVSSAGHTFTISPLPSSKIHRTCPGIGNWSSTECPPGQRNDIILNGLNYGTSLHPVILMRVNKGITFDLNAIRADMPETRIERFTGLCGITAADRQTTPNARASFYVLVDGDPRFLKKGVSSHSPGTPINIELNDTDRFLTLLVVFTEITPDKPHRAMFAEPSLELVTKQNTKQFSDGNQSYYP
jgi:hypothetical protein